MAQLVKIRQSFINIEQIRIVQTTQNNELSVVWSNGETQLYTGQQALDLIKALEHLKMLSISIPES